MFKPITKLMLAAAVTAVCASSADALTVNLTIDDATRVAVELYGEPVEVHTGLNTFEDVSDWTRYEIFSTDGNILKEVNVNGSTYASWATSYELNVYYNDYTVNVTSAPLAEVQTGQFTVNVDNPEKVRISMPGTGQAIEAQAGANVIKFIPEADAAVSFSNTHGYDMPFYSVTKTLDGETTSIAKGYSSYDTTIEDGMVIDIVADFPADLTYPVSFEFVNPGTEGYFTSCTVGGQPIADFTQGFTAHAGEKVVINRDNSLYKSNSITRNGESESNYSTTLEFALTEATTIVADVTKYNTYNLTVNINDPEAVGVYRNYVNDGNRIPLKAGQNIVEVAENNNAIYVKAIRGYQINSIKLNGADMEEGYNGQYNTYITSEGNVLDIDGSAIVYDNHFIVYVDDASLLYDPTACLSNKSYEYYTVNTGYSSFGYLESEAPFRFGAYAIDYSDGFAYFNNEPMTASYGSYSFTPENNGVYKFYFAAEPSLYTVNFTIEGQAREASAITGKYDIVKDIDFTQPLEALTGTGINIYGNNLTVKVNDTEIPCIDDMYSFTVQENSNVVISRDQVGIEGINADTKANNVYNLQGILMIRNASEAQIQALPAGMYIINGKKIIKK